VRKALIAAVLIALFVTLREGLDGYALNVTSLGMIAGALGMSLSLLVNYAGLPSLAHAAFYGTGGYAVGLLAVKANQSNLWLGLLTAAAVTAVLGLVVGVVSLRTRGIYFQIITLSVTAMLWGLAVKWRSLTGGDDGLVGVVPPSLFPLPGSVVTPQGSFTVAAAGLLVVTAVVTVVRRSAFGHVLVGIRDSESRMASLGYNTWAFQLGAFVLSGVLAGLTGALLTYQLQFISPAQVNFIVSIQALLIVVLGAGTLWGPAIAGIAVTWVQELLQSSTEHWTLVLGLIYIAVALVDPPLVVTKMRRRSAPPGPPDEPDAAPAPAVAARAHSPAEARS
jgi:branched-chain amino acid transport system permease protein